MTGTVTPRAPRLRRLLGLPVTRGHGRFIGGNLIDSLGNGMLLPLGLLYFTTLRDLPLAAVGAAVTVGQLTALPVVLAAGRFMDRHGPKHVTVTANVVSAAGLLCFLLAERPWQIAAAYFLVQSGVNAYYTAQRTLILHAAPPAETRSWFAFTGSLRNVGIGAGALLAAGALALFGTDALTWLVVTAAPLYLLAALCFARVPTNPPPGTAAVPTAPESVPSGGRAARKGHEPGDMRRYLLLVTCNIPFVLSQAMLSVLIAVYATETLGLPAWSASILLVVNTAMVATLTSPLTAHAAPEDPRRTLALGHALLVCAMVAFAAPALPTAGIPAWPALVTAIILFSLAEIFYAPAVGELSVTLTPSAARGSRQSLYQLSWSAGNIAAPALFTGLLDADALLPWTVQGVACAMALAAIPALKSPAPHGGRKRP
ncbi:MFS transporter [Streptomyces sp. NPDC093591]|uniref:MFS transporter n=1 Tax=Streptomyces sp. NPDC093591 TaxID=3366044 RepID=UPI0037F828D9